MFLALTVLNPAGAVPSPLRIADGSTRRGMLLCVHATSPHCAPHTLGGFEVPADIHRSQGMSPSPRTNSMTRRNFKNEKRSSHTDSSGSVSRRSTSSSRPATSSSTLQFCDIMEITNPATMQVESVCRGQPHAEDALYGSGGYENIFLRREPQE